MKKTIIRFNAPSFKKSETPETANGEKSVSYGAVVNIKDLPELEDWRSINARDPNIQSNVSKKIRKSLESDPNGFYHKNRGLTLIVDDVVYNNKTQEISITMTDPGKHWLLDWGHTYAVIQEFIKQQTILDSDERYVKLEIITWVDEPLDAIDIVEARNTARQVQDRGIMALKWFFKDIEESLSDTIFGERVSYREFELDEDGSKKDIDVRDILACLICFDKTNFSDTSHPIKSYTSKVWVLNHFEKHQEELKKYMWILPQIMELYDTIYLNLPKLYGRGFTNLESVKKIDSNARRWFEDLPYIGKVSQYIIPKWYIMPILASFRNLINLDRNKASFVMDPKKLLIAVGEKLASRMWEMAVYHKNPNKSGKDIWIWTGCYDAVENYILKNK
jgi:hypothetical protein